LRYNYTCKSILNVIISIIYYVVIAISLNILSQSLDLKWFLIENWILLVVPVTNSHNTFLKNKTKYTKTVS